MSGFFEKFIFELEAFSYNIKMGLSLANQLMSPEGTSVSSAKFTILISWSPVCTPLILCHYHWNGWQLWLQQQTETLRASDLLSERRTLSLFLDWVLFCAIHIRQMKLSWKSRNGNKKFRETMPKALAEFY